MSALDPIAALLISANKRLMHRNMIGKNPETADCGGHPKSIRRLD